jgi:hypothetical protein
MGTPSGAPDPRSASETRHSPLKLWDTRKALEGPTESLRVTAGASLWVSQPAPNQRSALCHTPASVVELGCRPSKQSGMGMMQDDVLQLVWATYNNTRASGQAPSIAFDRTVEMVQLRRPLLTLEEAHSVVSQILAG